MTTPGEILPDGPDTKLPDDEPIDELLGKKKPTDADDLEPDPEDNLNEVD